MTTHKEDNKIGLSLKLFWDSLPSHFPISGNKNFAGFKVNLWFASLIAKELFNLRVAILLLSTFCLILIYGCESCDKNPASPSNFEPLEFPFKTPSDITRMAEFGRPNWSGSEPHNGIDLVIDKNITSTKIISPTHGKIQSITVSENPYSNPPNQLILQVNIYVNSEWAVSLVFEPSTIDENLKAVQRNAIKVKDGQVVSTGDEIGDLLVGNLGYPHLHYMVMENGKFLCAYDYSSETAKQIFGGIANRSNSKICY